MTYEKFLNKLEYFHGWRCINCGEIVDAVIMENRAKGVEIYGGDKG